MARQKSVLKFEGRIGDLSFFKSKTGFLVREKGGVSADRIRNDPNYARTRENAAEFGRAGTSAKVLRTAIRSLLATTRDSSMVSRLTKEMMRSIKADGINPRGLRTVEGGQPALLNGFDFNANAPLRTTMLTPFNVTYDRATGAASIDVDPFKPSKMLATPGGSTHFKLSMAAFGVDFADRSYKADLSEGGLLAIADPVENAIALNVQLDAALEVPVFVVLGIEFSQVVNNIPYSLQNGTYNALSIVLVDTVVN